MQSKSSHVFIIYFSLAFLRWDNIWVGLFLVVLAIVGFWLFKGLLAIEIFFHRTFPIFKFTYSLLILLAMLLLGLFNIIGGLLRLYYPMTYGTLLNLEIRVCLHEEAKRHREA